MTRTITQDGLDWEVPSRTGPRCLRPNWVRLVDLELRSFRDWSEYEEAGGFYTSCGKCEVCMALKRKDWQGRIIGQSVGSPGCYHVTLTFGGDRELYPDGLCNDRVQHFVRKDMVLYLKRLRKYQSDDWRKHCFRAGIDPALMMAPAIRAFWVGERGDIYQRPHYHLLLFVVGGFLPEGLIFNRAFFHGRMRSNCRKELYPNMDRLEVDREYWPFGTCLWKEFDTGHAAYVAGYVNLPGQGVTVRPGISYRPILGGFYFDDWARRHVEQGVALRDRLYTVPVRPGYSGRVTRFYMNRSALQRTALAYADMWDAAHGERLAPESPLLRGFFEAREYRKLGTPELAMARTSFFMVERDKAAWRAREAALLGITLEELADNTYGPDRRFAADIAASRTDERIAQMGNRISFAV